jgi:hypothetical protein
MDKVQKPIALKHFNSLTDSPTVLKLVQQLKASEFGLEAS